MKIEEWYRRNLPHLQPLDGTFNICFRLSGSLPVAKIKELREKRAANLELLERQAPYLSIRAYSREKAKIHDQYFGKFDHLLDFPYSGPTYLKREDIAEIVKNAIHYWDGKRLRVICYCIMPNHVHLIVDSCNDQLFKLLKSIKNYSARLANERLKRKGCSFWQKESYDQLIMNQQQLAKKVEYILQNPVAARLVPNWKEWPYSYLHPDIL